MYVVIFDMVFIFIGLEQDPVYCIRSTTLKRWFFFSACIKPQWYEENGEEDNAAKQFYSRSRYELLFQYSIGKSYSVISILSL